jgi:hypothetical protein
LERVSEAPHTGSFWLEVLSGVGRPPPGGGSSACVAVAGAGSSTVAGIFGVVCVTSCGRRPLAESLRRINLAELDRNQRLTDRHALKVQCVRDNGERVEVTTVYLEATRMHFGGRRLWFRCPRCDGRCRVLHGTWRIACRRCHKLRYCSQRETKEDRATRAMLKIVRRLNPDDPDPCNDLPEKPQGMHWSTYDRFVERYETYNEQWGLAIMRRFGRRIFSDRRGG